MARTRVTPKMQDRALAAMRTTRGTTDQDDGATCTSKDETVRGGGDSVSDGSVRREDTSSDAVKGLDDDTTMCSAMDENEIIPSMYVRREQVDEHMLNHPVDPHGKLTEDDDMSEGEREFVREQELQDAVLKAELQEAYDSGQGRLLWSI